MAEELLRQKVYRRVNELKAENPGKSNMELLEMVRQEMGFDKLTSVSANYYRAKAEDPQAPVSKRGRPRGSKNKAAKAAPEPKAAPAAATASAAKSSRPSRSKAAKPAAKTASASTAKRASSSRPTARRSRAAAATTEASQAMDVLSGLVAENERLLRENQEMRERLAQVSQLAAV